MHLYYPLNNPTGRRFLPRFRCVLRAAANEAWSYSPQAEMRSGLQRSDKNGDRALQRGALHLWYTNLATSDL